MAEETHKIDGFAGQPITLPKMADLGWKKENYIFAGWAESPDSKTFIAGDGTEHIFEKDTDLYAIWNPTNYLCFTAQETTGATIGFSGAYNLRNRLEYSLDNKKSWTKIGNPNDTIITLPERGSCVYIRANTKSDKFYPGSFVLTGKVTASGNIMSLLDPELQMNTVATYCFSQAFKDQKNLVLSPELPATVLSEKCYEQMFCGCTSLIKTPKLPATTLSKSCYNQMFYGCTALTETSELPAMTLEQLCYSNMFQNCTSLQQAPKIFATTYKSESCSSMFNGCTNLSSVPALPVKTMYYRSCMNMFIDCIKLKNLEVAFESWDATEQCYQWLINVPDTADCTFICPTTLEEKRGTSYIPSNWTIIRK